MVLHHLSSRGSISANALAGVVMWLNYLSFLFTYVFFFNLSSTSILIILQTFISSSMRDINLQPPLCFLRSDIIDPVPFDLFLDINERARWDGKGKCKTVCCSRGSDTWALQEEWGKTLLDECQYYLLHSYWLFKSLEDCQTTM